MPGKCKRSFDASAKSTSSSTTTEKKDEEEFEVEAVLKHRTFEGKEQYLVKWKNYDCSFNQWIADSDLNCDLLVKRYWSLQQRDIRSLPTSSSAMTNGGSSPGSPPSSHTTNHQKSKVARLDFAEIANQPRKPLRPNTFEYDLAMLMEKYQNQWRIKHSQSSRSKKLLVRLGGPLNGSAMTQIRPLVTQEQKQKLDQELKEWIDEVNVKNDDYGVKPIHVENNWDLESLPPVGFTFIVENKYSENVKRDTKELLVGCNCSPFCSLKSGCCPAGMDSPFSYRTGGKLRAEFAGKPIFECNHTCSCKRSSCLNRTVQRRRQVMLCIFRTMDGRGWGVKTLEPIAQDSFVLEYVGEVVSSEEADQRFAEKNSEYLFDLDFYDADSEYVIDATFMANEAHFVNHSCDPNLRVHAAFIETLDIRLPRIALFACRDIAAGEELTFDYSMAVDALKDETRDNDKLFRGRVKCLCAKEKCRGFVFVDT